MRASDLFKFKTPEIRALHLTWIAFFYQLLRLV